MVIYKKSKYFSEEIEHDSELDISPLLVRALRARGAVTAEQIERFLNPSAEQFHDPFLLPDMDKAVERIRLAMQTGERICVFGDYDVDGICSAAMLTDYFRSVGADVVFHIPSRSEEGYGMSAAAVDRLFQNGVGLIVTVDNGISAAAEIEHCTELGIDVIVTDHHIPPAKIPRCTAVVCHTVAESRYPQTILCGAGIAFKLLHALAGLDTALKYVSLAGLASVADVVPLIDENRVLVKLGLAAINDGRCCMGLARLLQSIPTAKKPYNVCNLGFAVAPRLNASGRMSDASLSVRLFLSNDPDEIDGIIAELNRLNELRQQDEAGILGDAMNMLASRDLSETRAIVLLKRDWNSGVIGIAASRILETFHRPTILFCESNGVLKGSARSIDGVNIHEALSAVSDCFISFGGHAKAAGVTMDEARFDEFQARLNEYLKSSYESSAFVASKNYEFEIPVGMVDRALIDEISLLAPFGEANPSPVFRSRNISIGKLRRFGNDAQHTRMEVFGGKSPLEAVWFSSAPFFHGLLSADKVDIIYTPSINSWCGNEGIQLRLKWAQAEHPADIDAFIEKGMWNFCDALVENFSSAPSCGSFAPPVSDATLSELIKSRISGLLAIAFSPEGARRALREIEEAGLSVDVCFGGMPSSPVCDNTLLIAPKLCLLPDSLYNTVLFCDEPLFSGTAEALCEKLRPASVLRLAAFSGGGFGEVGKRFNCDREFIGECYRGAIALLSGSRPSFEELVYRLSERTKAAKYCVRFALRVFMELGFIGCSERGSLMVGTIRPAPLTDSALYSTILELHSEG